MKIVVAVTLYNSSDIIERTLGSIMSQSYENFVCYITDDLSTDGAPDVAEEFIEDDDRFILIRNEKKLYQGGNYDLICRDMEGIDDEDILVEVDGDDWLPDRHVFQRVIDNYNSGDIWITNGSFRYKDGRAGFSAAISDFNDVRNKSFVASHLRTWKMFLWRAIKRKDLKTPDGNYWETTGDLSFMFPMLEMAGEEHYLYSPEINYVYNDGNPLNDHKLHMPKVHKYTQYAKTLKRYDRLVR